jgi:hypothetical protein
MRQLYVFESLHLACDGRQSEELKLGTNAALQWGWTPCRSNWLVVAQQ